MTNASGYDVIVCGSGSNHLVLSALLACRGVNVLVLSTLNGKRFGRDEYQFPDEHPLFIDFGPDGVLGRIFEEINLPLSYLKGEEQIFRDLIPSFQVVSPDYRIDIFHQEEDFLDELCREIREDRDMIISLFNELNSINSLINDNGEPSFFRKIKASIKRISLSGKKGRNILEGFNPSGRLTGFFDMLSFAFYGIGIEETDALRFLSIMRLLKGGGRSVMGGIEALNDLLVNRIRSEGGEFNNGEIDEVVIKGRKISGIKTKNGDHFGCKMLVIEREKGRSGFTKDEAKSFSFYFGIDKDFVPSAMGEYLAVTTDCSRSGEEDISLLLSLSPLSGSRWTPADKRGIIATTLIPASRCLSGPYMEGLKNLILDCLIWLIPFSSGHIDLIGDDSILERHTNKWVDPVLSLQSIPKNLYLLEDGKNEWIRTSDDLKATYKIAGQITDKI